MKPGNLAAKAFTNVTSLSGPDAEAGHIFGNHVRELALGQRAARDKFQNDLAHALVVRRHETVCQLSVLFVARVVEEVHVHRRLEIVVVLQIGHVLPKLQGLSNGVFDRHQLSDFLHR
jgi:hypothetical protein